MADEKTFTGELQKKAQLEDKNGNPYWEIDIGTHDKFRTYRLFRQHTDLAKSLVKGKTYTVAYTQEQKEGREFPQNNVVDVKEAISPVADSDSAPSEFRGRDYHSERRSIERQTALKAAAEIVGSMGVASSMSDSGLVLKMAEDFYAWLSKSPVLPSDGKTAPSTVEDKKSQESPAEHEAQATEDAGHKPSPKEAGVVKPAPTALAAGINEKTGYIKVFDAGKRKGYPPIQVLTEILKVKGWETWLELGGTTQSALDKINALEKKG